MTAVRSLTRKNMITLCLCLIALGLFGPRTVEAREGGDDLNFGPLTVKLIKDGYGKDVINSLYGRPEVAFETKAASLFIIHDESKLNYGQFLSRKSVLSAREYMKEHKEDLAESEKAYDVDKEIITAIILVETRLGTTLGGNSILNTLSTLATLSDGRFRDGFYDLIPASRRPKRDKYEERAIRKSKWAYAELKAFLTYTSREKLAPEAIKGSYAGALGIAQFMPSSILRFAKDGNHDGNIDLFNHADAIASIASYLKHFGWHKGVKQKQAHKIIRRYNYSTPYADTILKIADSLRTKAWTFSQSSS